MRCGEREGETSTTPCPDEGISVPSIEYGDGAAAAEFFAFSEFWYSMEDVLKMGGPYSPAALKKAARVRRDNLGQSHPDGKIPFSYY